MLGNKFTIVFAKMLLSVNLQSLISKKDDVGSAGMKSLRALALIGAGVSGFLSFGVIAASADEAEHGLPPPNYPWPHKGILSSYDHAS